MTASEKLSRDVGSRKQKKVRLQEGNQRKIDMAKKNYKYFILIAICLCGVAAMYCQYQMAPVADRIIETYQLSQVKYSMLFSAPMVPAIFLSLVSGIVVDKIGAKRIIFIALLIGAAGLWGRVGANNYALLYVCTLCPGLAATFVNSTNVKIFGEWFEERRVSIAVGLYLSATAAGMAIGTGTTALFSSLKAAFAAAAILTSVTALVWLLFMRDKKEPKSAPQEKTPVLGNLKVVLKNRDIILACLGILCAYGCYIAMSSYLPSILQSKGLEEVSAGSISSIASIGYLVGCLVIPVIVGKINKFRASVFVLAFAGAALIISIIFVRPGLLLDVILFILGMCIGGIIPLFMSLPVKIPDIGVEKAGTAGGLIGTFQLLGAVILPSYVVAPLSGGNYSVMLALTGVICVVVCVFTCFLTKETEIAK